MGMTLTSDDLAAINVSLQGTIAATAKDGIAEAISETVQPVIVKTVKDTVAAAIKETVEPMIVTTILAALDELVMPRFDAIETRLEEHSKLLNQHSREFQKVNNALGVHTVRLQKLDDKLVAVAGEVKANGADIKELYRLVDKQKRFNSSHA